MEKGMGMEKIKINNLYRLLERAEKELDKEDTAALRWAISKFENN